MGILAVMTYLQFWEKTLQSAYSDRSHKIQKIARIQKIGWICRTLFFHISLSNSK